MKFNLNDYETVESRIKRFYSMAPDGRIITEWENSYGGLTIDKPNIWVVKAKVYLSAGDHANDLPKATGYAFEKDGSGGANNTSALENAETSAIGRALANMDLSGNKRASREEMDKVNRASAPERNWLQEADKITDVAGMRWLHAQAKTEGASAEILERIIELGKVLSAGVEGEGADGGLPGSSAKRPKK